MSRVAWRRKNSVPRTIDSSWSRSSPARSSSPVASGTGGVPGAEHVLGVRLGGNDLLGAHAAVARAPALVGAALDGALELQDAVHEGLGPGRATGDVDVPRHELARRHERVVVEHAHGRTARAHGDRPARLEHLVVDAPDDRSHLDRDAARHDEHVGLAGRGPERLEAEAGDVGPGPDHRHHLDGAAGQAERGREERVGAGPVQRALQRRGHHRLLDELLELGALQVAAEHVAGLQLAGAELVRAAGGLAADYLHSSAPRRHTYTKAIMSRAMKTMVSVMANVPKDLSCTAIG